MPKNNKKVLMYSWLTFAVMNQVYFLLPISPFFIRLAWLIVILIGIASNINKKFSGFDHSIILFEGMILIMFFFNNAKPNVEYVNIANTSISLLSFIFFDRVADISIYHKKALLFFVIALFTAAILSYYYKLAELVSRLLLDDGDSVTVNASSIFLMLFPLSFLIKQKKIGLAAVVISSFYILSSVKRGNIIALSLPLILFIWLNLKEASNSKKYFRKILILFLIIAGGIWIQHYISTNEYFQSRLEQTLKGGSSGRDVLYVTFWNMWYNTPSTLQWLMGYGYDGTIVYGGVEKYAHNDWLEILVDFGLLGFVLYLAIFIQFFKIIKQTKAPKLRCVLISVVFIWLIKSLISMGFTSDSLSYLAIAYGYVIACNNFYRNAGIVNN